MTLTAGTRLGHYEILSPLGAGGMGEVYRAREPADVASDRERVARFEREARAVATLSHPNILSIHEFSVSSGTPYAVTELLHGETLRHRIDGSPIPWREAVRIAAAIADGVAAAHANGVIHRDLKPENIFLTSDGQVKVLDFGLAHVEPSSEESSTSVRTEVGQVMGSRGYMSPEQVRGESIGPTTDLFSLGCVMYEMLTGQRPFDSLSAITKCLRKHPQERFQSARDLAFNLRSIPERTAFRFPRLAWISALLIVIVSAAVLIVRNRITPQPFDSIAVLPFVNLSHDPDAEYLSEGITETLINDLSEISGLRVIPRASVFRFKGNSDFHDAASKLHVRAVVTGRVLHRGDTLNVQAELIDVDGDRQLWGAQYQKRMSDLTNVQSEIARDVSGHLRLRISPGDRRRVGTTASANPSAYEAYLRGRYFWNKRTIDGLKKSIDYFQHATDVDPTYALAYTGLSDGYGLLGSHYYGGAPPTEAMPRAKAAALKALDLDPNLGEAHASLAWVLAQYDWNLPGSEKEFRRAIALNPNYATAHQWLGITLACEQKYDEAIAEVSKAHDLDPLASIISYQVGWMYYFARRYAEAEQRVALARDLDPTFVRTYIVLSLIHLQLNKPEDGIADAQQSVRLSNGAIVQQAYLARAYAVAGKRKEATHLLDAIIRASRERYVPSYFIALIYVALGEQNEAFAYLEKSFDERSSAMTLLPIEPALDPIRSDSRFADLLRRVQNAAR
ncbi:MAG: hypothetical protein DMF58_15865 [Acidobacteria bacterium]|nr:MAG: hypothetical protein DMF58_15865 [Acidobacteriota bacterium]